MARMAVRYADGLRAISNSLNNGSDDIPVRPLFQFRPSRHQFIELRIIEFQQILEGLPMNG